jgi:PKD repeat protein
LSHNRNDTIYATDLSLGNHTISFKVQDNNGTWSDEDTIYLTVKSFPTASVVSISPNPAHEGAQVNFTGTGADPDGNIVGYQWRSV